MPSVAAPPASPLAHPSFAVVQEMKSCDVDLAGCGRPNGVNHFLQRAPRVFTLNVRRAVKSWAELSVLFVRRRTSGRRQPQRCLAATELYMHPPPCQPPCSCHSVALTAPLRLPSSPLTCSAAVLDDPGGGPGRHCRHHGSGGRDGESSPLLVTGCCIVLLCLALRPADIRIGV